MKAFAVVAGIFVFVVLMSMIVIMTTTKPVMRELTYCIKQYGNDLDKSLDKAKLEKWGIEKFCINGTRVVKETVMCYEKVENNRGSFATDLTWFFLSLIRPKEFVAIGKSGLIESHNSNCNQFPNTQI